MPGEGAYGTEALKEEGDSFDDVSGLRNGQG